MTREEWDRANQRRTGCLAVAGIFAFVVMLAGGMTMATLYEKGQRLDARAYWIMGGMVVPFVCVAIVFLIWRLPPAPLVCAGCPWCGRMFVPSEFRDILRTQQCPSCGQHVPFTPTDDNIEDAG